jgi:uncharacterized membrane protein YphA (DoxX/SURF4 family)
MVLHAALGVGLLAATLQTFLHAMSEHGGPNLHLGFIIALEGIGAVLFLIPRTLRVGAIALLVVLLGSFAMHVTRGEFEAQLLVYAAAVWFVMAHGAAWGGRRLDADAAA